MKKLPLMVTAFALCSIASAQTDITNNYITNPSFEQDDANNLSAVNNTADGLRGYTLNNPSGWTVSGEAPTKLLVTANCYTDNNFGQIGTIADGTYAYYLREEWTAGTGKLQQTVQNLPRGTYKLTVQLKSGYANNASSVYHLFAGGNATSATFVKGNTGFMTSNVWTTSELTFTNTAAGNVNIGLSIDWIAGGSCLAIDDFRLEKLSDDVAEQQEPTEESISSYTENVVNSTFAGESEMKSDLLKMLAKFSVYLKNDFQECVSPNSIGESCGCFKSNSTMKNNEDGVRSNVDLGMITAFLAKYGKGKITLPAGVTWDDIDSMAMKSLVFAYSTHKANKLKVCSGNNYWGSTSTSDTQWESSLWSMGVAYSSFFLWDKLTDTQKKYIHNLLTAECNYELGRTVPTGYKGDTKAEENGWEVDVLAAAIGLFPHDGNAKKWYDKLREFAINCYSHESDAGDNTIIDPLYDSKTVGELYKGQNLYSDYTLQNHNYFHTSYQNVVIQELGEAALALKLFQKGIYGEELWKTNALMHNNLKIQQEVLNWLALADGELAMPNGNDWSLFLYDQITSYSTNATFLKDPDALMLENLAYKMIKARQQTTPDGSWLLRSDIGARRMGVEGHRVMMTYLMHDVNPTADIPASKFDEFRSRYASAHLFKSQNIIRAYTKDRFTTFSWADGISSYTGYIAANSVDKNKIIVPFKANNTGNFLGWYTVKGKTTNASPVVKGRYQLDGEAWTMNGELYTNDGTLDNRFAIYSTPGNAVIYLDYITAISAQTITKEQGGLMAISTDPFTKTKRTLYYGDTHKQSDGIQLQTMNTDWVNIDNQLGVVAHNGKKMAFGDQADNNSILTSKVYAAYNDESRNVMSGETVDCRNVIYYSNTNAATTKQLSSQLINLKESLPEGWNGVIASDPDSSQYLFISNFKGSSSATLKDITTSKGAPIYNKVLTVVDGSMSSATFTITANNSLSQPVRFYIQGSDVKATACNDSIEITADKSGDITLRTLNDSKTISIKKDSTIKACIEDGKIIIGETLSGIKSAKVSPSKSRKAYNIAGIPVDNNYEGIIIADGKAYRK